MKRTPICAGCASLAGHFVQARAAAELGPAMPKASCSTSGPGGRPLQRLHRGGGDAVTAGQLLFEFDPTPEQAASAGSRGPQPQCRRPAANTDKGRREG